MSERYLFRKPTGSPQDRGASPPRYRQETGPGGMIIERDVPVPVRGGVTVYADVFRPVGERPAPPLIAWSPYGKHAGPQLPERYPDGGVAPGQLSEYTAFESPDPVYWTARGYAVVNADIPGTWFSGGDATFLSPEEAACGHDLVEWAGTQSWSNGRVGLSGVSYLTSSQWTIGATRPPHLAAINPWEGWSDTYREVARHGGIPETYFWPYIGERWGYGTGRIEDLGAETAAHPLFDDFWAAKAAPLGQITVPAYVVASWSDQGLHTRGTFEGFTGIGSERKWLDAHGGKKWGYYYSEDGLRRQQAFFDHFLLGRDTEISDWPRVSYQVRDHGHEGTWKSAADWPVPGTSFRPLYLDAATGTLTRTRPAAAATVSYDSERAGRGRGRATFDFRFEVATELVGGMRLKVWMSAPEAEDLDVFVAVQKLDAYGDLTGFPFYAVFEDGPVALGWLRASHRELDQARSRPWQPVLAHRRELPLAAGQVAPLEVEILPSGTLFRPGETLRLVIQGRDVYRYPRPLIQAWHDDSVNRGPHVIHAGGGYDSHLLVPTLSADDRALLGCRRRGERVGLTERRMVMAAWSAESGHIEVSVSEAVAVVTLRRPDQLNALTAGMRRELAAILRHFGDGHSVRGIVVTGTGRAFSAGLDLKEAAGLPPGGLIADVELFHDITRAALQTRVPVVAAVNGIAVGGACEMTLCFDARVGTPAAEFFLPENNLGLTISNASSVLLPRLVGARAIRLVLESARIGARDALAMGLLDEIVEEAGLIEAAIGLVHRWTPSGAATAAHLGLLRPPLAEVEQAMAAETEAASGPDAAGLAAAGINRFLGRHQDEQPRSTTPEARLSPAPRPD